MKVKIGAGIKRFFVRIGGWIKKHKVLFVIILLAVTGIIFFAVKSAGKKDEVPVIDNTEVLTKQTISNIVSTSGKIVSADSKKIILPDVVLNNDKLFLDDMSLAQFKERYPGKVEIAKGAKELLHLLLER